MILVVFATILHEIDRGIWGSRKFFCKKMVSRRFSGLSRFSCDKIISRRLRRFFAEQSDFVDGSGYSGLKA